MVGGKEIPGSRGEIGAYIAKVMPGGVAEQTGKVVEGKRKTKTACGVSISNNSTCISLVFLKLGQLTV